ncbi:MAG: hypothetical protein JWM21_4218 [Acidobacteria bacterium]|nr:hypothetical protein [Acidobacteriota bacterium]
MTHTGRKLISLGAITLLVLLASTSALAGTDSSGQSGRYSDSSKSVGYTSKYALDVIVRQLAYQSMLFQWQLESDLNRSYLDGSSRERRANQLSVNFRGAAETLHSRYASGRSVDNSTEEAGRLLQLGNDLDDFLSRTHLSRDTLESWHALRCKLSVLADVYADSAEDANQTDSDSTSGGEIGRAAASYDKIWRWPF